jgi:uncharacterized protein YkwD
MAECDACGREPDSMLYTCNECSKTLCPDHRLPEKHLCGISDRVDEPRHWTSGSGTSPVEGEDARAECKSEDCTNASEPDSRFCPNCLNRHDSEDETTRERFGETDCKSPTCNNVAGHGHEHCVDCRRDRKNASAAPAVETTDGSPYNTAGSGRGGQSAVKRARVRASDAFSTAFGLLLLPFFFLKDAFSFILGFLTSKAGVVVIVVGIAALAAGPLGIVDVNGSDVDDATSGVASWVNDTAAEATDEETLNESMVQELVHEEVNERRENRGLSSLQYSEDLEGVARSHATDMLERGYFAHDAPNGSGPQERYYRRGIGCNPGENIAMTHAKVTVVTENGSKYYETNEGLARGIVNQWMNSTGHRENILRPSFFAEGIGIRIAEADDGEGLVVYAVQNFCAASL